MEKKKITNIVIVIVILLFVGVLVFRPTGWVREIDMYITVDEYAGFNVGTEALFFGTVPAGGTSKRTLTIDNIWDTDLEVQLSTEGELAGWTHFSKQSFTLAVGGNETVDVAVSVPGDAAAGNYAGRTIINFREK